MIWRNPETPMSDIAKRIGISKMSVSKIVRKKLGSRSYRMGRGQLPDRTKKKDRLQRAQKILDFLNERLDRINRVLFTDEKVFQIGRYLNKQNHRQILNRTARRHRWRTIGRTQFPELLMVWAGVSGLGKTKLAFIKKGVRINSTIYQEEILKKRAKRDGQKIFGQKRWWF